MTRRIVTGPRAVVALAVALVAVTAMSAYAATFSGKALGLAPGDSVTVTCAGPSLVWSRTNTTTGSVRCKTNPAPTITTSPPTATTTPAPVTSTAGNPTTTAAPTTTGVPVPAVFPNGATTGTPAGTVFTRTVSGDYTVNVDNTAITAWHITGSLLVQAKNVTVSNSWIDGSIDDDSFHTGSVAVADTTIGPAAGCISHPGLLAANFTASRVHIQGHDNGFQLSAAGAYASVSDSFARICANPPVLSAAGQCSANCPDGSHSDGFQAYCPGSPCGSVFFDNDTLDITDLQHTTAAFYAGAGGGLSGNGWPVGVTLQNSLLIGGTWPIYLQWDQGANYDIRNNVVARNVAGRTNPPGESGYWDFGAVTAEGSCAHQNWSGNALADIDTNYRVTSVVGPLACIN